MTRHNVVIVDAAGRKLRTATLRAARYESGEVGGVLDAVRAKLGIDAVMLLCVESSAREQTHLLQAIDETTVSASPLDASVERAWRNAVADGIVWAAPGWLERTREWIDALAREHGADGSMTVEQVRVWEFSSLLRTRTGAHDWIVKALPLPFLRELRLLRHLAGRAPAHMPLVLAADEPRQCLVMARSHGTPLAQIHELAPWRAAMRAYATIQLDWIDHIDELAGVGLPSRLIPRLLDDMQRLLTDGPAMLLGESDGLSMEELHQLRARIPEIEERCDALEALAISATIEHGDLWEANILVEERGAIFLDWTDASIAHPFFSLCPVFAGDMGRTERAALRDAYLAPWRERFPASRVDEAFDLAQLPAALHHAVNYHRFILPMVRTERGAQRLLPFYLRRLLAEP